jgi:hypothetical protein
MALVRKRTIPTERPPFVGEVVPTFADRGCRVISAMDSHGRILYFLDRSCYYFFQVAPQLYTLGWVEPIPDPLLLRKSGSAENRTRDLWICSQELWSLDHRGGPFHILQEENVLSKMMHVILAKSPYKVWEVQMALVSFSLYKYLCLPLMTMLWDWNVHDWGWSPLSRRSYRTPL